MVSLLTNPAPKHDESYYNLTCQSPEHCGPFSPHNTHCKKLLPLYQFLNQSNLVDPTCRSQAPVKKHKDQTDWYQCRFVDLNFGLALALLDYLYLCIWLANSFFYSSYFRLSLLSSLCTTCLFFSHSSTLLWKLNQHSLHSFLQFPITFLVAKLSVVSFETAPAKIFFSAKNFYVLFVAKTNG